jgi:probable rRNA maturation factor
MATLNKKYRGKIGTTDVLSFPTHDPSQEIDEGGFFNAPENGLVLGDIIVSYPMAIKEAMQKNMMVDDVIAGLVEHGLMHLLGIHHPE